MENLRMWKEWAKYSLDGRFYKLCVLLGIAHSPTFEIHKAFERARQLFRDMQR